MKFLTEKLGFEPELNQGLIASVVFHIGLFLFAWFGVPHLFSDEIIYEQAGIKAAILSDITAAPKVDKVSDKPTEKPKQQKVETPKKKVEPAPAKEVVKAASAPPPPEPEQQAAIIPDKTIPKDEKPPEKKPEPKPDKKKTKKPEPKPDKKAKADEPFDPFKAFNLDPSQAAEASPEEPKKNAAPEPTEPTEGQQAPLSAPIAVSATDADSIGQQIGKNWQVDIGALPDPTQYMAWLRVSFDGEGNVQTVEFLDNSRMSDPKYRMVAESCRRAFFITKRVQMPSGKQLPSPMRFGCDPQYANGG